jgi:hypothetical protein
MVLADCARDCIWLSRRLICSNIIEISVEHAQGEYLSQCALGMVPYLSTSQVSIDVFVSQPTITRNPVSGHGQNAPHSCMKVGLSLNSCPPLNACERKEGHWGQAQQTIAKPTPNLGKNSQIKRQLPLSTRLCSVLPHALPASPQWKTVQAQPLKERREGKEREKDSLVRQRRFAKSECGAARVASERGRNGSKDTLRLASEQAVF